MIIQRKRFLLLIFIFSILTQLLFFSNIFAQSASKLQILLPGMTAAPGTETGFTGQPDDQTTGVPFEMVVNAVDDNWNIVSISDQISISASDPYATLPLPANLVNGRLTLAVTLHSSGSHAISAHDDSNPAILGATSPSLNVANISHFTISEIGDPWWVMPGQVTVGNSIKQVEIIARNSNGDRAYNFTGYVNLAEHTDYGIGRLEPYSVRLEAGKWKGTIKLFRAGKKRRGWGVTGDVWVRVNKNSIEGTSNRFCALPRSVKKLLTILPGENYLPGSLLGKTGSPIDQQAGKQFYGTVYATDDYWNQISDIYHRIGFLSSDPDANLPAPQNMNKGEVQFAVQLNTAGNQTVTASDLDNSQISSCTSSPVMVLSQELDHFVINSISSPRMAGETFPVIITAVDAQNNLLSDFNGYLDLTVTTGIQTISPAEIYMSNGWWSGDIMITKAASLVIVTAKDRTNPPHSGMSNQFDVQPGQLSKLQVILPGEYSTPGISPGKSGSVGSILAGTSLSVRVNAVDNWWNVVSATNDVVHLTSTDQNAQIPADASLLNGSKQFIVTLNTNGLQTISSSDVTQPSVLPGVSSQIRVNSGNLHRFVFNPISTPVTAGQTFSVGVTAVDIYGNSISDYSGIVLMSSSTGENSIIPNQININQGNWTGNVTLTKASDGVFISVSDFSNPPHLGNSNEFKVDPGPLAKLQVLVPGLTATPGFAPGYSGTTQAQNSGEPFSAVINGVDLYWNIVSSSSDSFGVSSTDPTASLPEATILNNGSKNVSISLSQDGSHTISAFHLNNPAIENGQSPPISILPRNLDHFLISQIGGPIIAGTPIAINIQAVTNTNDLVKNFSGTLNLTVSTGEGTVSPTVLGPFDEGEWSGDVVFTKAANDVTISVDDGATPVHSGLSNPFIVMPGPFEKLQVLLPGENPQPGLTPGKIGSPTYQQTGSQFEVVVRAVDNYWNLVSQTDDSIKVISSDTLAMLPSNSKLINGTANPTVIMGSVGIQTITAIDISDSTILSGISSGFSVNPGNLDRFIFSSISIQIAGDEFLTTITAADIAGNPIAGFNGHARLQATTGDETISPTDIEFVDGIWSGNITITKSSENVKITCLDYATTPHTGQSNSFNINPGEFTRLQILLPGQTSTPGIAPGKIGDVETQIAGDVMIVVVNAVDTWWNPLTSAVGTISLTTTDSQANLPMDAPLQTGSVTFTDMRFTTPGYWSVTAHCLSNPQISTDTSPLVHVITGSVASFVFDGISSPQVAGDTIQVSIRAVDGSGSVVSNYNDKASVTASTGPGTIIIDEVQFQNGVWNGPVVLTQAMQSAHLNIHNFADIVRGNSSPFTLVSGPFSRLQILLPGETAKPGHQQGKEGQTYSQTVGIPFEIKLNATDTWWNLVQPNDLQIHFSSSDLIASLPNDTSQTSSFSTYTITLLTTGDNTISVQSTNMPELIDTSSVLYVQSGDLDHFVFSQIENVQKAGHPFTVRIDAHNQYNFPVTDYQGDIILSASTGNGTLSKTGVKMRNGFWEGELFVTKSDSGIVLSAADYIPSPNTHTGYSNSFNVKPDIPSGLQVLLPGEINTPGVTPGKEGSPNPQTSGVPFDITILAVDSFGNLIPDADDSLVVSTSDSFAVLSDQMKLKNGTTTMNTTIRAAGEHHIFVKDVANNFAQIQSEKVGLSPNQFTQLLLLLPGEESLPGDVENDPLKTPGRKGIPTKQTSGLSFAVNVFAVDNYWNPVSSTTSDRIHLFTTDSSAQIIPADTILVNGTTIFSVTLNQGGNQVLRAINETNSNIRTSMDAMLEVLVGGLHYEIVVEKSQVSAGEEFNMHVFFKNGIGELVTSANHLVHLSLVNANDVNQIVGTLANSSFDLQSGKRSIKQICDSVGLVRIKVTDEIGNEPAYSDPFEVLAGSVTSIQFAAPKTELRGLEEVTLSATLSDHAGNPVSNCEVQFSVISGSGQLKQNTSSTDDNGVVQVGFKAGKVSEVNVVRAQFDTLSTDFEIITNLTLSTQPDGIPINYPNPFGIESDFTSIDYYLSEDANVTLQIFDLFGNLVWSKKIKAGELGGLGRENSGHPNSVIWDGVNDKGQKVGNGGYILIARADINGKTVMNTQCKIAVLR